jgi:hypothetical protein
MDSSDTFTFTELIFFHLPEEVKPEDPDNLKGKEFLGLFQQAKQQDGHCWSAWGRTEENKSALVWVVGKCSCFSQCRTNTRQYWRSSDANMVSILNDRVVR